MKTKRKGRAPAPQPEHINLDEFVRGDHENVNYFRIIGDAMEGLGVFDGDLLVVDRDKKPAPGGLVVWQMGNEVVLQTYKQEKRQIYLATVDGERVQSNHEPIFIPQETKHLVWATVTHIVRTLREN